MKGSSSESEGEEDFVAPLEQAKKI
jgi:cAMP-dependent protein kinase regulator